MKTIISALILLLLAWIAWPYWAAYDLVRAVKAGDVQELEEAVDWQSVRAGFREDAVAVLVDLGGGGGKPSPLQSLGAGLAAAVGGGVIDRMLETVVTPQTLALLVRQHAAASDAQGAPARSPAPARGGGATGGGIEGWDGDIDFGNVRYAFFTGPATFELDIAEPSQPPLGLVFSFDGRWRLSRVVLPIEEFRELMAESSPQMRKRLGNPSSGG